MCANVKWYLECTLRKFWDFDINSALMILITNTEELYTFQFLILQHIALDKDENARKMHNMLDLP